MICERTLAHYRLRAYRKWFDSVPPRPAASLLAVKPSVKRGLRTPI